MDHLHQPQQYTCPMHAQIVKDAPGKCPICGMNLVPIKADNTSHSHELKHEHAESVKLEIGELYYCPMHCEGDKKYSKPGNCPVCGMHLVKEEASKPESKLHSLSPMPAVNKSKVNKSIEGQYYCPMLCEGDKKYLAPGNCPVCGMHLVKEEKLVINQKIRSLHEC